MNILRTSLTLLLIGAPLVSQTQLVRGDVDGIRNTAGLFQLECTQIPLVSNTVNLQQLHDQSRQQDIAYEMQVINVGSAAAPRLEVVSAVAIAEQFEMGNLRFGRSETWELRGPAGAQFWILLDGRANTRYQPFAGAGTWLLGPAAVPFLSGQLSGFGQFQTRYTMPTIPSLVGQEVVGQAVLQSGTTFTITNPDCKEVRGD